MPYHLLTGATGLLGTYLLRDCLSAGQQIAVVVRASAMESPRQRVESIMARWERELGYALPRPPVLVGNLSEPELGLDRASLDWVAHHCVSVIHNAASLSFAADERTGEPYRSNVEGTRNVLEVCRKTGIRQFHHVSTAYVCGLRTGRVLEDELDVGQQPGNEYEKTKIQAEKMVRGADFLDPPTVYRPAIIIGDSATGYSTTFHGFYTPLKIGQALVDQFQLETIDGEPLIAALGLTGQEQKNFVPVDWVSRLIAYLHSRPEHHGRTYHLALPHRVPIAIWREVIEQTLREYSGKGREKGSKEAELSQMQEAFVTQMGAYRAYWRDDPEFDTTNTARAAPHLASCDVGFETLLRTARFAIEANFGWPRPQPVRPEFDVEEHLRAKMPVDLERNGSGSLRVALEVNGPGGGQWTLAMSGGRPVSAQLGLAEDRSALLYLSSKTFRQCAEGQIDPQRAAQLGLLVSETGELAPEQVWGALAAAARTAAAD